MLQFKPHRGLKPLAGAAALLLLAGAAPAAAATLPAGDEVARLINARDEGNAVSRTLVMELTDRRGKTRTRVTRSFRKFFDGERRIAIFYKKPSNVRDTAFLTFDYVGADEDDDQWLYLPALRKTRRISSANRGDYFMGTDFTYDDIKQETKVSAHDYRRETLRQEDFDGRPCLVVEAHPVNETVAEELGYGRVVSWVDSEIWMIRKSEFWDTQGNPLKTMVVADIRQVQGIWTPHRFEIQNHKTGHTTVFAVSDVDYNGEVSDRVFTKGALKRGISRLGTGQRQLAQGRAHRAGKVASADATTASGPPSAGLGGPVPAP